MGTNYCKEVPVPLVEPVVFTIKRHEHYLILHFPLTIY